MKVYSYLNAEKRKKDVNKERIQQQNQRMQNSESLTFSHLTQIHINKLKDAFQMIDHDGDGTISQNDLSEMFHSIGKQMSDAQVQKMLQNEKSERGNSITFPEFLSLMSSTIGEFPEENEIADGLKNLSGNDELQISMEELLIYLREAGFQNPEKEFEKILKEYSSNHQTGEKVFKGKQFLNTISE